MLSGPTLQVRVSAGSGRQMLSGGFSLLVIIRILSIFVSDKSLFLVTKTKQPKEIHFFQIVFGNLLRERCKKKRKKT